MAEVSVQKLPRRQWPTLAPTWEQIHAACPDASFFLSRAWVDSWLATFGDALRPELLTFTRAGDIVGCCLLVFRTQWLGGVPVRRVYLNASGEDAADSTCIEYNAVLAEPAHAAAVIAALGDYLRTRSWDELVLDGVIASDAPLVALAHALGTVEVAAKPSHYIDLGALRRDGTAFDRALSSNTRQQIRRSQKLYEAASGPCELQVARTPDDAAAIFGELVRLHQAAWQQRGEPGVFASRAFAEFHRRLIRDAFARGHVLLVALRAGGDVIGALYSFVDRGRLAFYQSGFRYSDDGRLKPGLLTHYFAIRHCIAHTELVDYDFLAGDSQYKRSLAAAERTLHWIVVRRPTVINFVVRTLRRAKRRYAQLRKRGQPAT